MRKLYLRMQAMNRIAATSVLVLLFVCTASAYTIVMRGGKRIEIPDKFQVTGTTLTYEAGPDIQITLQLAAIDILATEKANNETAGALLRRVGERQGDLDAEPLTGTSSARRTITNRDLQSAMVRRRQSELAYEKRRQELGLPTVAESRRRAEAESTRIWAELEASHSLEVESESYWRARASSLRTEMASLDAELDYLRQRLEDLPSPFSGGFTSVSVAPFISSGISLGNGVIGGAFTGAAVPHPYPVYGAPQFGRRSGARVGFGGGGTRGQVLLNSGGRFRRARSFGGNGFPFPIISNSGAFGSGYDYSYERNALITHFNELATARAGLNARWRELENEARRAGAPPGWLRP